MKNENLNQIKKAFRNIFGIEITTNIDLAYIPEEYNISREGKVSLKLIKNEDVNSIFERIEMIRFEDSIDACNFSFILKSVKTNLDKLNIFQNIIDTISKLYGEDVAGRGLYSTKDSIEIESEYWPGRNWLDEKKYPIPVLISKFDPDEIHITLFLGKPR